MLSCLSLPSLIAGRASPCFSSLLERSTAGSAARLRPTWLPLPLGRANGSRPARYGQRAHPIAVHLITSDLQPAQQSRHLERMTSLSFHFSCPAARRSSCETDSGLRPSVEPSGLFLTSISIFSAKRVWLSRSKIRVGNDEACERNHVRTKAALVDAAHDTTLQTHGICATK